MPGDLWMELTSPDELTRFMRGKGLTVRALADRARVFDAKLGRRKPLSVGYISMLRTGDRRWVAPEVAWAIEEALEVPPHILFEMRRRPRATFGPRQAAA